MATGGTLKIQKDYEEQKHSVKRFAYDILYITLSKCGIPETHLEVKLDDKKNDYRHPNYVITVHYAVMCIALGMRDQWKHMFEYKQKSSGLSDMQKVEKYLVNIEELLEFRRTDELEKMRKSLAFYSELILFLHYSNLDVDFGKLLDLWSNYFNEKIAVNYESDVLLVAIFENYVDLSFVDGFLENVAKPYGKQNYVSQKFKDIYEDAVRCKCHDKARADMEKLTQEFGDTHLESKRQNPIDPSSKVVKKSVAFSAVPAKDSALSGSLSSRGRSIRPRIVFSPRSNVRGAEFISKAMNIVSKETPQEREDQGSVLPDHRKYFEKPSAMAAEETRRIPKGYEGQKYSIKRFAYDVLHITLSKCGFPKTRLQVKLYLKENNYRHFGYVLTVYSAVICNALTMRDKWKRMFEYKQKSYVLNDMQKVETYLVNIEVLPEFSGEGELYKIWRSLAFYSELILFLHHNNLEVDFERFLDIWSNYFYEKIAVNHEPDVLLEGLFITDRHVTSYVDFLDGFLQETAIPYGKIADVSKRFRRLSEEVEKFYDVLISSAEEMQETTASPSQSTTHNLPGPIPENAEEPVSIPSPIARNDSVSPDNHTSP